MIKAVENEIANRRHNNGRHNNAYPAEQMQYWGMYERDVIMHTSA